MTDLDRSLRRFRDDGDAASMEEIVRATRPRLLAIAGRIGAPQDAEDSVQAAYHALLRRADLPADVNVLAWLVTATVRIAYRRKAVVRRDAAVAERLARPRDAQSPADRVIRDEEDARIRREVHRLPGRYRDAVVLHHLEGLPVADVARLLDVPAATVKTRVQRGRALLRSRLAPGVLHAVWIVPWLAGDAVRAAWSHPRLALGGATKSVVAATVLAAAVAAAAVTVLTSGAAPGTKDAVVVAASAHPRPAQRTERVRVRAEAPRPDDPDDAAATQDAAGLSRPAEPDADARVAADVAGAAKALGVSDAALDAAWEAFRVVSRPPAGEWWTYPEDYRRRRDNALAALHAHEGDGFRAVVALIRGGADGGLRFVELTATTQWRGQERLLVETAEMPEGTDRTRNAAVRCLALSDTPEVAEWLLARAVGPGDPASFSVVAEALGRVHEVRGIPVCRDRLRAGGPGWTSKLRADVASAIAAMDEDEGRRALVDLVHDPGRADADLVAGALKAIALRGGDRHLARTEAAAFLESPGAEHLGADALAVVRKLAAEEDRR